MQLVRIKKLLSIFFVVLVLVSTTGLAVDSHMCQGELKSIALFCEATECPNCPENKLNKTDSDESLQIKKKSCCENHHSFFKSDFQCDNTSYSVHFRYLTISNRIFQSNALCLVFTCISHDLYGKDILFRPVLAKQCRWLI